MRPPLSIRDSGFSVRARVATIQWNACADRVYRVVPLYLRDRFSIKIPSFRAVSRRIAWGLT
jgi:hypothetical protein